MPPTFTLQCSATLEFASFSCSENFASGCLYSPDGTCVLTCTDFDNTLRIYEPSPSRPLADAATPSPMRSAVVSRAASPVYDFCWYPQMDSRYPATCAFLSTCRDGPIHLLDAYSGHLRATYKGYSLSTDELSSALSLAFSGDGKRIYAGYDACLRAFDVERPGRDCWALRTSSSRKRADGQKGLISAIAPAEALGDGIVAAGSYAGSIYLYDERDPAGCVGGMRPAFADQGDGRGEGGVRLLEGLKVNSAASLSSKRLRQNEGGGAFASSLDVSVDASLSAVAAAARSRFYRSATSGGVTSLKWSPFGGSGNTPFLLYSASRRSDAVVAWDVRFLDGGSGGVGCASASPVASYYRSGGTNQKLDFDLSPCGNTLFAGSRDGRVLLYDTAGARGAGAIGEIGGVGDACNGVSVKGGTGGEKNVTVAVAVGQRHFDKGGENDTSDTSDEEDTGGGTKHLGDVLVFDGTL